MIVATKLFTLAVVSKDLNAELPLQRVPTMLTDIKPKAQRAPSYVGFVVLAKYSTI